jgi:hypothetical protein
MLIQTASMEISKEPQKKVTTQFATKKTRGSKHQGQIYVSTQWM